MAKNVKTQRAAWGTKTRHGKALPKASSKEKKVHFTPLTNGDAYTPLDEIRDLKKRVEKAKILLHAIILTDQDVSWGQKMKQEVQEFLTN